MNTAIQIKTHTNKSASKKNVHILRESEDYKNIDIEVLKKTNDYKFQDDVIPVQRADANAEKKRQDELRKVNNKINTYKKRLKVFQVQNNTKKITSLSNQITELEKVKEKLKEQKTVPENRGKKRTQNYVEFELSLTNSNQYLQNIAMQNALKNAVERLKKTKILKELIPLTEVLHKDQYSLHIHLLTKVPNGKTWDAILQSQVSSNKQFKDGRSIYKNLQNTFQKFLKEEILNSEISNAHRIVNFKHRKGVKYTSLKQYKALNPLKKENIEESIELKEKELLQAPRPNLQSRLDDIELESKKQKLLDKLVEQEEANTSIEERSSNLQSSEEETKQKRGRKDR